MATWGDLKTNFFVELGEAGKATDLWEFASLMDEAQLHLASILPARVVPEMIRTARPTRNISLESHLYYGCNRVYARAGINVTGLRWDPVDWSLETAPTRPHAVYREARYVEPSEFYNIHQSVDEGVWTQVASYILTNITPGSAQDGGERIQISYKIAPTSYRMNYGNSAATTFYGTVTRDTGLYPQLGANRVALLDAGSPVAWADLSIDDPTYYDGGWASFVADSGAGNGIRNGLFAQAFACYEETSEDWGSPGSPATVGIIEVLPALTLLAGNQLVTLTPGVLAGAAKTVQSDAASPALNSQWHAAMLDRALAKMWLQLGNLDKYALYDKRVEAALQRVGVTTMEK